jgi:pimeloyl-ACP methyl ester carboxylesterase
MKVTLGHRLKFILLAVAIAFAGLNLMAYRHVRAMLSYAPGGTRTPKPEFLSFAGKIRLLVNGVNVPRPEEDARPSALAMDAVPVTIHQSDRSWISAWYCGRGADAPLVILFHGYAACKAYQLREARAFLAMGCSVLMVDFRGSGESSGSDTTIGYREADDVAAVVEYARGHFAFSQLVLFGQSMGAAAILRAVHHDGIRPDAVVIEAVFDTMLNTVRNRFRTMKLPAFPAAELLIFWGGVQKHFNAFAHRPVRDAVSVTCPALFMHGADDPRAQVAEARRVYDAVPGRKQFVEFPATGHESYAARYPAQWSDTVSRFIAGVKEDHPLPAP